MHGIYSDDYIATEVLTGHPAMVPQPFGRDVVRKYWLLHDLMRALALRHDRARRVRRRRPAPAARRLVRRRRGVGQPRREGLDVAGLAIVLPQYGFMAFIDDHEGGLLEAGVYREQGQVVEVAHTAQHGYVNPRQIGEEPLPAGKPLKEIDFGTLRTSGAFRFTTDTEGKATVFTPLPRARGPKFVIRVDSSKQKLLQGRLFVEVLAEDGKVLRREPARREGDAVLIECEPGVFAYRFVAGGQ